MCAQAGKVFLFPRSLKSLNVLAIRKGIFLHIETAKKGIGHGYSTRNYKLLDEESTRGEVFRQELSRLLNEELRNSHTLDGESTVRILIHYKVKHLT
jgi:hypothetical protein